MKSEDRSHQKQQKQNEQSEKSKEFAEKTAKLQWQRLFKMRDLHNEEKHSHSGDKNEINWGSVDFEIHGEPNQKDCYIKQTYEVKKAYDFNQKGDIIEDFITFSIENGEVTLTKKTINKRWNKAMGFDKKTKTSERIFKNVDEINQILSNMTYNLQGNIENEDEYKCEKFEHFLSNTENLTW